MSENTTKNTYDEQLISAIQLRSHTVVSVALIEQAKVSIKTANFIANTVVVELESYLHGIEDVPILIKKQWPKTWWEHFKERWFPKWALKKWPVQYDIIWINERRFKRVCPHLQKENQSRHLKWLVTGDNDERYSNQKIYRSKRQGI